MTYTIRTRRLARVIFVAFAIVFAVIVVLCVVCAGIFAVPDIFTVAGSFVFPVIFACVRDAAIIGALVLAIFVSLTFGPRLNNSIACRHTKMIP
jgi:hypothetical protein